MNTTQLVEQILRDHPRTRSSDKALFVYFMQESGMGLSLSQIEKFKDMPSLESVRRTRQKIQEGGKYEAVNEVKTERSHKSMVMQQTMPSAKPKQVVDTLEFFTGKPKYVPTDWRDS